MKIFLIFLIIVFVLPENQSNDWKCGSKGCYEVIKTFAELLEHKINATDAILAEAENELNEITFGNEESFKLKIKEVDANLLKLIIEIYAGVDGGDKNLFELINNIFDEVEQIEILADEVQLEGENADMKLKATSSNHGNVHEIIRELQENLNKLQNSTSHDGPKALQDAFDVSEKFNTKSSELKEVLNQVKQILKDYEENLINAKLLTSKAIEKFAKVSLQADETEAKQKDVEDKLIKTDDMKMSEDELNNLKKLVKDALEQTKLVYEDAFDLLNEVSEFELNNKLDHINDKVNRIRNHSNLTEMSLKEFADENAKFLDEMEKTIEAAEIVEAKAFKLQIEITTLLKTINDIHEDAKKAVSDTESIIENARSILSGLEDFTLKVEESRENARTALEKIPDILNKIKDSVKIVEKLENKLDNQTKAATDAKEKCSTAKEQMDEILSESGDIKSKIEELEKNFEGLPADVLSSDKEAMRIFNEVEKLEISEAEDSKLITSAQEKVEETKTKVKETDLKVEKSLDNIHSLMNDIAQIKNIDQETLDNFEAKINEAEKELDESHLKNHLNDLKARRHEQSKIIEQYKLEVSHLEHQISIIKKNAASLENRCFKRTRLEP